MSLLENIAARTEAQHQLVQQQLKELKELIDSLAKTRPQELPQLKSVIENFITPPPR